MSELLSGFAGVVEHWKIAALLMDAALKSLLVLGMAAATAICCRRASASTRHWIWFLAVTSLPLVPFISRSGLGWDKPLWSLCTDLNEGNKVTVAVQLLPSQRTTSPKEETSAWKTRDASAFVVQPQPKRWAAELSARWLTALPMIWLCGMLASLAYALLGHLRVRTIAKQANLIADADLFTLISELSALLCIKRPVRLLQSVDQTMPMTWGGIWPVILLPADAANWSSERRRIVLLHELAHIRRGDCMTQMLTRFVCAMYWFNPLAWLAFRRMRAEREQACDDLVLQNGCAPSEYASELLNIARSFQGFSNVAAIAMARPSKLENRIVAIVDASRARRAPRALLIGMMSLGLLAVALFVSAQKPNAPHDRTAGLEPLRRKQIEQLKKFSKEKEKQSAAFAEKAGEKFLPLYQQFFEAATQGDFEVVTNLYDYFKKHHSQYVKEETTEDLRTSYWQPVLEICLAYWDVAAGESKYTQIAVDEIIKSIPSGSIYFGGTDPGRGLPTAFTKSHIKADPFFTLTQNALADGTYLDYLRNTYGGKIYTLTADDSQQTFQEYLSGATKRAKHDSDFPNEPRQLKPGEDVRIIENRTTVSGQVAVMAINARLTKIIFERNPQREFYIEESFPLDWMYPYLEPHGLIMKINREQLAQMSTKVIEADHNFWKKQVDGMLGNWLKDGTTPQEVAEFVEKVYGNKDLRGFSGDVKFIQNQNPQKMFSKWRSAIGGVYYWRAKHTQTPGEIERMERETDYAFRQAFAMCPSSPESIYRYVDFLMGKKRYDDALYIIEAARKVDPGPALLQLATEVKRVKNMK